MSHRRSPAVLAGALLTLCAVTARAGSLDAPAAPNNAGSALYTLDALYNRLDTGETGTKRGAGFAEPTAAPVPTMYDLNALMEKMPAVDATNGAAPGDVASGKTYWGLTETGWGPRTGTSAGGGASAAVPKTGQTTCYYPSGNVVNCSGTGQDGALQKGVTPPSPRFTDNVNGTVTDNLTGLIWLKNANCFGNRNWTTALNDANTLSNNFCQLSDGSTAGQWRLPNIKELQSLVDFGRVNPAFPSGHPFSDLQDSFYWSSTSIANYASWAWGLYDGNGGMGYAEKSESGGIYVWPVRGGQ